ncbi:helix-turn-helix domain-containing protein [Streptomyces sp. NPDC101152]|uniref:helix-turn-helix domain-containing protein n=1 Tax=Streptomyces sp. NPDC101152 TaxID=3366116 RepID=UPI00382B58EE
MPESLDGSPITAVAQRYGISRQSVYTWKAKYAAGGLEGLREASRRPRTSPTRLSADVEALVCEMRRSHPRGEPDGPPTRTRGPVSSPPRRGPPPTGS